jgi:arylformamidase
MRKIFDLSPTLRDGFPTHPANTPAEIRAAAEFERDGHRSERLNITSHTGCHVDAPAHLVRDGRTIDAIPIEDFVGPCVVLDVRGKPPDAPITVRDLEPAAARIRPGVIVLLFTGWSRRRAASDEYLHHSPCLAAEAAQWLASRRIKGVGVDHFSVGTTERNRDRAAHLPLLQAGIWILEDLDIPDELLCYTDLVLYAAPLKLANGSGAPARPFAIAEIADP